jgi:hypothetical protein
MVRWLADARPRCVSEAGDLRAVGDQQRAAIDDRRYLVRAVRAASAGDAMSFSPERAGGKSSSGGRRPAAGHCWAWIAPPCTRLRACLAAPSPGCQASRRGPLGVFPVPPPGRRRAAMVDDDDAARRRRRRRGSLHARGGQLAAICPLALPAPRLCWRGSAGAALLASLLPVLCQAASRQTASQPPPRWQPGWRPGPGLFLGGDGDSRSGRQMAGTTTTFLRASGRLPPPPAAGQHRRQPSAPTPRVKHRPRSSAAQHASSSPPATSDSAPASSHLSLKLPTKAPGRRGRRVETPRTLESHTAPGRRALHLSRPPRPASA